MLLVGLTGGIGAGKSTVARMLEERGANVIDADDLARRAVLKGTPAFERVVEAFGRDVVKPDGQLDRRKLAGIVFADPDRRRELERITHPEVARLLSEALAPFRSTDQIVVYGSPLLVETGTGAACDVVVVVAAPEEEQLRRVGAQRALEEADVRARMEAQATAPERAAVADVILDNGGTLEELEAQVERLWRDIERTARERASLSDVDED
ncbi:MAG: dephospho-CoA kinase [Actinomycetota bacterium]|nr:dephospho-CoA kinase [Actinomycetota bacterium]